MDKEDKPNVKHYLKHHKPTGVEYHQITVKPTSAYRINSLNLAIRAARSNPYFSSTKVELVEKNDKDEEKILAQVYP